MAKSDITRIIIDSSFGLLIRLCYDSVGEDLIDNGFLRYLKINIFYIKY